MTPSLGIKIHEHLKRLKIETPLLTKPKHESGEKVIAQHFTAIMNVLRLQVMDDSLQKTPQRVAKMYLHELFYGLDYANFPDVGSFKNGYGYDEMIAVKAKVHSCCEHHFVPFVGTCHIAYIPKTKILGLSKFNRIVDFFSHRPQVQERLTAQIHATLRLLLNSEDIAVVIHAQHLCVTLRGVKDEDSWTVTSKISGRFKSKPPLRAEFLALTRRQ